MKKKIVLLDCTLRDGGYYNNWDFSKNLISKYLKSMAASGVEFAEIGFRSLETKTLISITPARYKIDTVSIYTLYL